MKIFWCVVMSIGFSLSSAVPVEKLKVPPGYNIQIYAEIPKAREIAVGDKGIVYVGTRGDSVYAIVPAEKAGAANTVMKIASGLKMANGVAFYRGDLYVAELTRIHKFTDISNHLKNPKSTVIAKDLPSETHHGDRYIRFSPDGWLYVSIGAPCNVCIPENALHGTIIRMKPDGSERSVFAKGVRNSVGFDWDPQTKELWFTDNGRDWLGDQLPPDEINHAPKANLHFGFPYCYGKNVPDAQYGSEKFCRDKVPSEYNLTAHVAALGMSFEGENKIYVAEHGSWNRSRKSGYQVVAIIFKNHKPVSEATFVQGWLQGEKYWGRPVDVKFLSDRSMLISDDEAGAIYRVSRTLHATQ